jgi:hypothetical protein
MGNGLYIVSICELGKGWRTPIIFREDQDEEMNKLILDAKFQHHTVTTTWIFGNAVEPLRQYFADEASAKVENKPELIPLDISTRSAIEVLRDPPTLQEKK